MGCDNDHGDHDSHGGDERDGDSMALGIAMKKKKKFTMMTMLMGIWGGAHNNKVLPAAPWMVLVVCWR